MTPFKKTRLISIIFVCLFLVSCAQTQETGIDPGPEQLAQKLKTKKYVLEPFNKAVQTLSVHLMAQINAQVNRDISPEKESGKIVIVIDPFINADSGEVLQVSRKIEKAIIKESEKHENLEAARLTSDNLKDAKYIVNGTVGYAQLKTGETKGLQKYYHIASTVRNLAEISVIGKSDVWVTDQDLDYSPAAVYLDNPFFFQGKRPEGMPQEKLSEQEYFDRLATRAMLIEAGTAYENRDYEKAVALFQNAEQREDGKLIETYAGLYMTHYKLGNMEEAEKAFGRIVALSVSRYNVLSVRFLFSVNSDYFLSDNLLRGKYDTWIRQIGKFFNKSDYCIQIMGHCSRTGAETYNKKLSLMRAVHIQKLMQPHFQDVMKRSKTIGMGFKHTIVGTGSDDDRDALDRRVEIKVVDCREF